MLENKNLTQYSDFETEMNNVIIAAEQMAVRTRNISFISIKEKRMECDERDNNWRFALGKYRNSIECKVYKSSAGVYTATVKYKIKDYYDWDPMPDYSKDNIEIFDVSPFFLYQMNCYGIAKNFHTYGCATIELEWTEGERIDSGVEISIVS